MRQVLATLLHVPDRAATRQGRPIPTSKGTDAPRPPERKPAALRGGGWGDSLRRQAQRQGLCRSRAK